jgi:methyl-accepting chemotaxis protein
VELGEEIGHFLSILKGETGDEFSIVADKEFLNKDDWSSARQVAGLRNNWDDLEKHLVISSTAELKPASKCFTDDNFEKVEKGKTLFGQIQAKEKTFICGGFGFNDAKGQHVGAVLSAIDLSAELTLIKKANTDIAFSAKILFIIVLLLSLAISRFISGPIKNLTQITKIIAKGDLSKRVKVESKNEIGEMADSFNKMLENLQKEITERVKAEEGLKILAQELESKIEELGRMNKIMTGRELKVIELKKEIEELKKKSGGA